MADRAPARLYWIASYPKSGNTWMRAALTSLRRGGGAIDINRLDGEQIASSRAQFDRHAGVEASDLTDAEIQRARPAVFRSLARSQLEPLLCKAHEAYVQVGGEPLFPSDATLGAVYIVRDPRDVAVSLAHHRQWPLARAVDFLCQPDVDFSASRGRLNRQLRQPLGSWSQHVSSWVSQEGAAGAFSVRVVRYEAMHEDLQSILARLASTLGWRVDDAQLASAVVSSRFERLQGQEAVGGFSERPAAMPAFFRKGRIGGWREVLSSAQVAQIRGCHAEWMASFGYD
jgi:aryl sulfotransferase